MLDMIKQLFSGEEQRREPPTGHQIAVAATALMVQLARVDNNQDDRELETIVECAMRAHEVTEAEARDILQDASDHADDATSLYEFTGKLNDHLEQSDKQRLLESIWAVALADGRIDRYEEHLIRRIADLLHLNHREYMQARHRAEEAQ